MNNIDKRRQIMQAAERLFTGHRFHEVTTDQVAREAHVGKGTIYRYFRSKDELFFETTTSGFDELCERIRHEVPSSAPFAQQLLSACIAVSKFHMQREKLWGLMQAQDSRMALLKGRLHERWAEKRHTLVNAVAEILRYGVAQGHIRRDLHPDILATYLLGLLRARSVDLRGTPLELRTYESLVDLFLHGAGAQAADPSVPLEPEPSGNIPVAAESA